MVEFKIKLDESIVQSVGHKQVETHLQDFVKKMLLKSAAQDIMKELESIDFQNDEEWQTARYLAWEQVKHKYIDDK